VSLCSQADLLWQLRNKMKQQISQNRLVAEREN
jgi:hypothetical protein